MKQPNFFSAVSFVRKGRLGAALLTGTLLLGLLLGATTAQAQTVLFEDPAAPTKATGILSLDVGGTLYNVAFNSQKTAFGIYGSFPGTFTFPNTADGALAAVDAVNAALNNFDALSVGQVGGPEVDGFATGYDSFLGPFDVESVNTARAAQEGADWLPFGINQLTYNADERTWAIFTAAGGGPGPGPPPLMAEVGGPYTGTTGVAVTFDGTSSTGNIANYYWDFGDNTTGAGATVDHTYTTPGTYTVWLSVVDDDGVSSDNTTAEIGSDTPPIVGKVSKVVVEGGTLADNTVLQWIALDGGVAINRSGTVAFAGQDSGDQAGGTGTVSVFTQDGLVVKEGGTLDDGTTIVNDLSPFGEVAISVGPEGDRVAFHGQAKTGPQHTADAVFTQAEVVALEGAALGDGIIVNAIKPEGKVAINDFGEVAFHGNIEVEGDGLIDKQLRTVFNNDGVVAKEGDILLDGLTTVANIDATGGVAINFLGEVAFHGAVDDLTAPGDTAPAVFTQDGLVAKVRDTLPDTTIVADIDENGGVAINFFGEVAFHGDVSETVGGATRPAVFTQNGLVVKEGDTLTDGITFVEEIDQSGGVGIDFSGNVVFHGRTDGVRAVFTQHGLVAKEGDILTDGTILDEIHVTGGVAISEFGEIAFHGRFGTTDAVLVGNAP